MVLAGMGEIGWVLGWIGLDHNVWFSQRNLNWILWCWLIWEKLACGAPSKDRLVGIRAVQSKTQYQTLYR